MRNSKGQFQLGHSGGWPNGARNRLAAQVFEDILRHWCEPAAPGSNLSKGAEALETLYKEKPGEYLRLTASVLPREFIFENVTSDLDDELLLALRQRMIQWAAQESACGHVRPPYSIRIAASNRPVPRSAATAVLPAVPSAPPSEQPSPIGSVPASDAKDRSLSPGVPQSEVNEASPPPLTPEPASTSLAAAPASEEASRLSAAQVTELLSRGDSFLPAGDVATARLFYERAADAGDWQAAIRMGATFDPAFLNRAGVRTSGDPAKAQSWYRHALDLGAPRTNRQVESPKTK